MCTHTKHTLCKQVAVQQPNTRGEYCSQLLVKLGKQLKFSSQPVLSSPTPETPNNDVILRFPLHLHVIGTPETVIIPITAKTFAYKPLCLMLKGGLFAESNHF